MNFLSLLSPTSILLGLVVALSISNAIFINLYTGARDDLSTYKAEVSLAQAQIEADIQRKLRLSEQVTADVRSDLDAALDRLRKLPAIRVQSNCNQGTGITLPAPTTGITQATSIDPVDTSRFITPEECEARLSDGIEDATRLAWLQQWTIDQHEASK